MSLTGQRTFMEGLKSKGSRKNEIFLLGKIKFIHLYKPICNENPCQKNSSGGK